MDAKKKQRIIACFKMLDTNHDGERMNALRLVSSQLASAGMTITAFMTELEKADPKKVKEDYETIVAEYQRELAEANGSVDILMEEIDEKDRAIQQLRVQNARLMSEIVTLREQAHAPAEKPEETVVRVKPMKRAAPTKAPGFAPTKPIEQPLRADMERDINEFFEAMRSPEGQVKTATPEQVVKAAVFMDEELPGDAVYATPNEIWALILTSFGSKKAFYEHLNNRLAVDHFDGVAFNPESMIKSAFTRVEDRRNAKRWCKANGHEFPSKYDGGYLSKEMKAEENEWRLNLPLYPPKMTSVIKRICRLRETFRNGYVEAA